MPIGKRSNNILRDIESYVAFGSVGQHTGYRLPFQMSLVIDYYYRGRERLLLVLNGNITQLLAPRSITRASAPMFTDRFNIGQTCMTVYTLLILTYNFWHSAAPVHHAVAMDMYDCKAET